MFKSFRFNKDKDKDKDKDKSSNNNNNSNKDINSSSNSSSIKSQLFGSSSTSHSHSHSQTNTNNTSITVESTQNTLEAMNVDHDGANSAPTPTPTSVPVTNNMNSTNNNNNNNNNSNREAMINIHERVRPQRAQNVYSQPLDLSGDYHLPSFPKDEPSIRFIDNSLADNFIFASLTHQERRTLIDAMQLDTVPAGTVIIKQGNIGDYFYVVQDGHVSFSVDGKHVGSCTAGASFGELALLYNCPRAATCIANSRCKLWKVDQRAFRYMLANSTANQQKDIHDVLRKVPFLSELDDMLLARISDALTTVHYPQSDRIIVKGDLGQVFYILKEGIVKVHDIGFGDSQYVDQFLGPGEWFGERALLTGEPRVANITAISPCTCLCLSRDTFEKTLGPLQGLIDHAMKKRVLMGVPIFANSHFQPYEMSRLTDLVTEASFPAGTRLAINGHPAIKNLYIIRTGRVLISNPSTNMINYLGPGDYFGETAIQEQDNIISTLDITVQQNAVCGVLTQSAIESVIGSVRRLGKPLPPVASKLDRSLKLKDLAKVRILGVGTFGKVWLVQHSISKKAYALKLLNKREIIGHHQVDGVIREKNIMASLDHPFVVNLICTFQDERSLYMLIELVQGGELFSVIHTETRDGIPNNNARFYAACVLESLAHLHHRRICYRDLKPENILIDAMGYGVLVDLGFAKIVMDKTYTLCGTPEYLAPEIILSKGHDTGVDYWAFGVLLYEMLVGRSPFYAYGSDQVSLFKRIVQVKYHFPPGVVNESAQDLILKLIVRRQSNRLGCLARGDMDIRDHPYFAVIDTEKLLHKKLNAPWQPHLKDPLDSSHFDSYKHVENEPLSTRPLLNPAQQELFRDF
jgi:CRP-like cAMP-binding protein/tRNA A-37 threonylcarbamoyl transferase component Bud32